MNRTAAGRFTPGHQTWNRGKKGWSAPGTEATRFKTGGIQPSGSSGDLRSILQERAESLTKGEV